MAGIVVFKTLAEAVRMGFQIYDRMPNGYVVQRQTESGFAFALVVERKPSPGSRDDSELLADELKR